MPTARTEADRNEMSESLYLKGVKHLCEKGVERVPAKYVLPLSERPNYTLAQDSNASGHNLKLPLIDFAQLQGPNRSQVLQSLANACQQYGFFQLVNHGIPNQVMGNMIDVMTRFFELPLEARVKYMISDMRAPVRYGTSFNQNKDTVFCWRDFLKLLCHPLSEYLPHWPASPVDLRELAATYAKETKELFLVIMEAILENLGIIEETNRNKTRDNELLNQFKDGSQLMVANLYPPCPQPDLTLGMIPHSDYGFLTLLLQDEVEGLQIQFQGKWVTVEPVPNTFVVNIGDHLEIFSNGKYQSVLHRVLVNSSRPRISVASLHSLPFNCMVRPSPTLIDQENSRRFKDTDFASFLRYISSHEHKGKDFLESRKLT